MTIQAFSAPAIAIDSDRIALWNALLSYGGVPLSLGGREVKIVFEPAAFAPLDGQAMRARIATGDAFLLHLTHFPFKRVFGAEFSVEDLPSLPAGLRDVLNEGILDMIWTALPDLRLGRATLVDSGDCAVLAQKCEGELVWFVVAMTGLFPEPAEFMLGCDKAALLRLLGRNGIGARAVWSDLKSRLTREVYTTIGQVDLSAAQVRALRVGDVVLLPADAKNRCVVGYGSARYAFSRAAGDWICSGPAPRDGVHDGGIVEQTSSGGDRIADLHVTLDFDIGQMTVSLADIESWRPGALVPLDVPGPAPGVEIHVRTGGRLIATGDLVRIDDRLAVRLNKILLASKS